MEIKDTIPAVKMVRFCLCAALLMMLPYMRMEAQKPHAQKEKKPEKELIRTYTVKDGKMYIELSKELTQAALDSFIGQYNLYDLALKYFIRTSFTDSLKRLGWQVDINNRSVFVISKPLFSFKNIDNIADKILFTEKHPTIPEMFPSVSDGVVFGYNQFRNKYPFAVNETEVTFFIRNHQNANRMILSGSFNGWAPDAWPMKKTDSGWIAYVKLTPGKYWYKFVADGNWMIDDDNLLRENDGRGNTNSVYYKTNVVFTLNQFANAGKVYLSGSFNNWRAAQLLMNKTAKGWQLPLYLADGTHTYRYVVDGNWYVDPANPEKLPNEYDDFNSVIRLGKPYLFKLNGYTNAHFVVLSGTFNKWRKEELFMKKTATGWQLPYTLGDGNYEYQFFVDAKPITDPANPLVTNKNKKDIGNSYLIINPNYTFRLNGYATAKTVYLAGDFDDWSPNTLLMQREGDSWVCSVHLSPGKHLYKLLVDGRWITDPANKLWEQNQYGTGNSVLWIDVHEK